MSIELRQCEPVHVPVLLRALGSWYGGPSARPLGDGAARSLLGLARNPSLGSIWLIEARGALVGYAIVETRPPRGFLWQEAALGALYLVPDARQAGVGRVVRRVLGELLLGRGCGLTAQERAVDDRHWALLSAPAAESAMSVAAA
jgi:GNAT superfamily N-acetyltransferase